MRNLIRSFDGLLRHAYGVYEFSHDPICLVRLRVTRARHNLNLPDGEVVAGKTVLEVHLWNERIPPIPASGADITWAVKMHRGLMASFRAVAGELQRDPRLSVVQAVGGVTLLIHPEGHPADEKLFRHLGFSIYPYHNRLGRFGEFWENFYTWGLMWTFNTASLRKRQLLRARRVEIWMSVSKFLMRYE